MTPIFSFISFIDDQRFVKAVRGTNKCTPDSQPVANLQECHEAATELGLTFAKAGPVSGSPKGCLTKENKQVYYNTHESGAEHADQAPICSKKRIQILKELLQI